MNETGNRRARELDRLEATGDRAGRDSLWAEKARRMRRIPYVHRNLAEAVRDMRDPATIALLAEAPFPELPLDFFGEAAVPAVLAALADTAAGRDRTVALLTDLARIAKKNELGSETGEAVAAALQGFLTGETLRARRITDPGGSVLGAAIDLAVALGDSASLERVHDFAADPVEMVRAGVSPRDANTLFSILRAKLGWTPPAMSEKEIAAELRTGSEQVLAVEFAGRLRGDVGEDLRLARIAALEHLNGVPVDEQSRSTSPVVSLQGSLVYIVGGLEDPRGIPALARSGSGFTCTTPSSPTAFSDAVLA